MFCGYHSGNEIQEARNATIVCCSMNYMLHIFLTHVEMLLFRICKEESALYYVNYKRQFS
jgi:hypothetical protein